MQFMEYEKFSESVRVLYRKGGPYKNAANDVMAMTEKARKKYKFEEIFSVSTTHNGENRLPHCKKYNLSGRARLVTVVSNDICMFLFTGDHESVDEWLDKNRGIDFIAKKIGKGHVIEPVFVSTAANNDSIIQTNFDLGSPDKIFENLSSDYCKKIFRDLPEKTINKILEISPTINDDEVLSLVEIITDESHKFAMMDVILLLRDGDNVAARNRIDLFTGEVKEITDLSQDETEKIISGDRVVLLQEVDQQLFEHFVKTANFQKWMLYLHPSQREFVNNDYLGPTRMAGVSGSGKTCVLIHRALRLAKKYPDENILVLTLNASLTTLINDLVDASRGEDRPNNLRVASFWEICKELLLFFEPKNELLYVEKTVQTNPYAGTDHIEEIWEEFYKCENNNNEAMSLWNIHQSLLIRNIFPQDYLKQEFDFIRSAVPQGNRNSYLEMDRKGRVIPLDSKFREQILEGLKAWERKMEFVGAVDPTGIAEALYRHIDNINSKYRSILVDEVQDFGTIELSIIRKLVQEQDNDIFLCGDSAQSVYTKIHDYAAAGINIENRNIKLNQNYRNSRQILAAAYDILERNFESRSKGIIDLEIIKPEYANFSSSKPLLLSANSLPDELAYTINYCESECNRDERIKICIAIAGYSVRGVEIIGKQLNIPVLRGDTTLHSSQIFLSDLEQTKGFEFDKVIIINCTARAIPHPDLPPQEAFRDLSKLYVAMTRAKTDLIISYHGEISSFINTSSDNFYVSQWNPGYAELTNLSISYWPDPFIAVKNNMINISVTAYQFLRSIDAVGLPLNAQQKLIECVTGGINFLTTNRSRRQIKWKTIEDFMVSMENPINRNAVKLGDSTWSALKRHFDWKIRNSL